MFDPSKIKLDLDNLDNKNISWQENLQKNKENNIEKKDVLEDISIVEEKKEESNNSQDLSTKQNQKVENNKDISNKKQQEEVNLKNSTQDNIWKQKLQEEKKEKIIYDINIDSLEYLMTYLISKGYDYFTLVPKDDKVEVSFRKDNLEKELKYIKFPVYNKILLKAKSISGMKVDEINESQEAKKEINVWKEVFKILAKTVPSNFWEKLFFKLQKLEKKAQVKKKEKMSLWKIFGIFGWLLFVLVLIAGIFISIILFNSNSVEDLKFFHSLWINANAIKDFAAKVVNFIFGFVLLVEIIFLFVFSYKALLTKKTFRQKKVSRTIIAIFFLILSTLTFVTWIFLWKKINALKWANYWKITYFDNSKLLSSVFDEKWSQIDLNKKLIWPVTIRFYLKEFTQKLKDDWFTIDSISWESKKQKWEIWVNDEFFIARFDQKWIFPVKLIIEWKNLKWEPETKTEEIARINIANIVTIKEKKLENWWAKFEFDAQDLKELWKVYWYYIPSLKWKNDNERNSIIAKALKKPLLEGYKFYSKNIFEAEEYYWIKIITQATKNINSKALDKIFIVSVGNKNNIKWELQAIQDKDNYKKYLFVFKNPQTKIWEAYIKEYIWTISDTDNSWNIKNFTINKKANLSNLEESSKVFYTFKKAWIHKITLSIIDSDWNKQVVASKIIKIRKKIELLLWWLKFYNDWKLLSFKDDIKYEKDDNVYYIDDLKAPSVLRIDTTRLKAKNPKYALVDVLWDLNNDWTFEKSWKAINFPINYSGLISFKVKYIFQNKNISSEKIDLVETIHITSEKKEALLDLKISMPNSYVPVIVSFDASNSMVPWKDIDKFIFDYWDWTPPEERDAKNTGHKYIKEWNYNVKLTVVTTDWQEYSITKKLVLKNKPQNAVITMSMKKAPVYQEIDFSAEKSTWEVASYFWDFGDWSTSTEISPSHMYTKPWKYKVKLELEFTNRNVLKDEKTVEIYEE